LNRVEYILPLEVLRNDIWYALVINLNQQQRNIEYWLYTRKSDKNPKSYRNPELLLKYNNKIDIKPIEYNIQNTVKIFGSLLKITNIRIFNEIISENSLQMVLSQYIVDKSSKLILSDNVYEQYYMPTSHYRSKEDRNV